MEHYKEIITVFLSGMFGLAVAITTILLSSWKESDTHRRSRKIKRYEGMESVYIDAIAGLEKAIRRTERLGDYSEMEEGLARQNARLQLASTKEINDQLQIVSNKLYQWSSEYRQGAPKKIGDTGLSVIGTPNFPHQESARELFPIMCQEIEKLAGMMKEHLKSIEA